MDETRQICPAGRIRLAVAHSLVESKSPAERQIARPTRELNRVARLANREVRAVAARSAKASTDRPLRAFGTQCERSTRYNIVAAALSYQQ